MGKRRASRRPSIGGLTFEVHVTDVRQAKWPTAGLVPQRLIVSRLLCQCAEVKRSGHQVASIFANFRRQDAATDALAAQAPHRSWSNWLCWPTVSRQPPPRAPHRLQVIHIKSIAISSFAGVFHGSSSPESETFWGRFL